MKQKKQKPEEPPVTYIISFILALIKYLNKIFFKFQTFLVNKYIKNDPSKNPVSEQYRKLQIDGIPIIEQKQLYDHKILLNNYQKTHGKPLKPVIGSFCWMVFLL